MLGRSLPGEETLAGGAPSFPEQIETKQTFPFSASPCREFQAGKEQNASSSPWFSVSLAVRRIPTAKTSHAPLALLGEGIDNHFLPGLILQGIGEYILRYGQHNLDSGYESVRLKFSSAEMEHLNTKRLTLLGLNVNTTHFSVLLQVRRGLEPSRGAMPRCCISSRDTAPPFRWLAC